MMAFSMGIRGHQSLLLAGPKKPKLASAGLVFWLLMAQSIHFWAFCFSPASSKP